MTVPGGKVLTAGPGVCSAGGGAIVSNVVVVVVVLSAAAVVDVVVIEEVVESLEVGVGAAPVGGTGVTPGCSWCGGVADG